MAVEEQVRAYGGPRFQVTQQVMARFAEAVERAKIDVVPRVLITGSGAEGGQPGGTSSVFEALLTLLLAERAGEPVSGGARDPAAEAIRAKIRESLAEKKEPPAKPEAER